VFPLLQIDNGEEYMKIQVLSDLHNEMDYYRVKVCSDADVIVLAGDIFSHGKNPDGLLSVAKEIRRQSNIPIVYITGNHEYYFSTFDDTHAAIEAVVDVIDDFHFLNNNSTIINGVKFVGTTLWTNFDLAQDEHEINLVGRCINDFIYINNGDFTTEDCARLNNSARRFLRKELYEPFDGKKVMVVHHCPSPLSIHPKFEGSPVNSYFACSCCSLIAKADLCIHGHTHESFDYTLNDTRVVCNPRDYYSGNNHFNGKMIVEI
jgi:predicted phosphodiesterase